MPRPGKLLSKSKDNYDKVRNRGGVMKLQAKITSKGQITVPLEVRKRLGVNPGDKIVFEENQDDVITVRPVGKESVFEKYRGIGTPGIGSGREAVIRAVREMRGFDPDDPTVE